MTVDARSTEGDPLVFACGQIVVRRRAWPREVVGAKRAVPTAAYRWSRGAPLAPAHAADVPFEIRDANATARACDAPASLDAASGPQVIVVERIFESALATEMSLRVSGMFALAGVFAVARRIGGTAATDEEAADDSETAAGLTFW